MHTPEAPWPHAAITTYGRNNHAVRTDDFRYIRYEEGAEELYDHRTDPDEWDNLAGDASARAVMDSLGLYLPQDNALWSVHSSYDVIPYFEAQRRAQVRR